MGCSGNREKTSNNSLCSFSPAWMTSFSDIPSHFAEQSNTILAFVVDFLNLTIRKCGECETSGLGASLSWTLRRYPLSTCVSNLLILLLDKSFFLQVPLSAPKWDSICHLSTVRSTRPLFFSRHCNTVPPIIVTSRTAYCVQCQWFSPFQYTQFYHLLMSHNSQSPKNTWVLDPADNNHQFHQSALYPWLTMLGWCVFLFQTVLYHQVRSNTNPSQQSQMSNGFTQVSSNINKWVMQISILNSNQQVHQSILCWHRKSNWTRWGHLTLLTLQFSTR